MLEARVTGHRGFDDSSVRGEGEKASDGRRAEDRNRRAISSGGDMHRTGIIGDKESAMVKESGEF